MTGGLIKRENLYTNTHIKGRWYEKTKGGDGQGEKHRTDPPSQLSEEINPANIFILDF